MGWTYGPRRGRPVEKKSTKELDEMVRRMKADQQAPDNYRERSLRLNGWVCAKCGQDFELNNLHLLTVHHKDGNHHNNPPDGSNWENLCVYCHDDEHSRSMLGDYLQGNDES